MNYAPTKTILLTGITGNLGAHAALRFLRGGHRVYAVVRGRGADGPEGCLRRVMKSLSKFGRGGDEAADLSDNLHIVEGDIGSGEGLAGRAAPAGVDETWHFASSLKYMPRDREEIFRANVDGLRHVMSLHRRSRNARARFFYISTAYLAGRGLSRVPEARIPYREDLVFNNCYEQSKLAAENLFLDALEGGEVEGAVFRPSIVTAERRSGRLIHYGGLYQVVWTWFFLSRLMDGAGERDKRVRISIGARQKMNFIPLDDVTDTMLALSERRDAGPVFNIVSRRPADCRETFAAISRHTGLQAIPHEAEELRGVPKTRYELLASYLLDYIHPYINNEVSFDTDNTDAVQPDLPAADGPDVPEAAIRDFVAFLSARHDRPASAASPPPSTPSLALCQSH